MGQHPTISPKDFDAVIFDLDGIVTRTADLHASAWKRMFDRYLSARASRTGETFAPFRRDHDYTRFVDGKPRYDGVRDFLRSRGIDLPEGAPTDDPNQETVCGLGNRKNEDFRAILAEKGARCYETTVEFIRGLHRAGIRTAVISASRNAREILSETGVSHLFEVRVDGCDAANLKIPGKPAPDIFLAAAAKLGVTPRRSVVVEDALAGVAAGQAGKFGLVVGVDRANQPQELAKFADIVVRDLLELEIATPSEEKTSLTLPSAIHHFQQLIGRFQGRRPAVFLDYDGTLTPIVERPELAVISDEMRMTLAELARHCTVAIVSGRDRRDVGRLVALDTLFYAGSHGFDIVGPAGSLLKFQKGREFLPQLDEAERNLHEELEAIEGAQVERKKFAIAVHFRRVPENLREDVEKAVDRIFDRSRGLRKTGGKMIFELRPDIDWDKGKALTWLLGGLHLDPHEVVPIYLGDDLTDEDAFTEIEENGIGILVRDDERPTRAHFALEDTAEVRIFLELLCSHLKNSTES